jgi:Cof subfamily protein (haloacid dehalogenase superfamily)
MQLSEEVMYKLIAVDLDGTLLNSKKQISQENKIAISKAVKKGVKIVICSGRIFAGARVIADEAGLNHGSIIACNGALIKELNTEKLLYSKLLNSEDCLKVIDICRNEDIYFHAYVEDALYTEKMEYSALTYSKKNKLLPKNQQIDIRLTDDVKEMLGHSKISASKFVVISKDSQKLSRARQCVEQIKGVKVMSSDYDNFEVVHNKVDKGSALMFIAEKLDIGKEEIIAIGDNENDISMLECAGMGVAMGNSIPFIKESADYITVTNDENGVAEVINKFIL